MKKLFTFLSLVGSLSALSQSTTWYEIPSGTDKQLNVVEFATPMVGYIGGNDSTLLKTTDGGGTWSPVQLSGVNFFPGGEHIVNLKFVSANVGYMTVGPYGGTYKTSDGGNNWTALTFSGNMCFNQGLYFFSEDNGVIGGSGCFQGEHLEVMDAGNLSPSTVNTPSWDAQDIVLDIDFLDSNFGMAVSQNRFLKTTDGGLVWDTIPHGQSDILLTSVEIINDSTIYAGFIDEASAFGILMSTDSGSTWSMDLNSATFYYPDYTDIDQSADGHLFVSAGSDFSNGVIFELVNQNWWFHPVDQNMRSIATYNDSTVFAVGDSGYVVTNIDPVLLSQNEITFEQEELRVFPNPCSEVLTIVIPDGVQQSNSQLIIRSLDGKEIRTLQNSKNVDVNDLSDGVYFIELHYQDFRYISKFIKN